MTEVNKTEKWEYSIMCGTEADKRLYQHYFLGYNYDSGISLTVVGFTLLELLSYTLLILGCVKNGI